MDANDDDANSIDAASIDDASIDGAGGAIEEVVQVVLTTVREVVSQVGEVSGDQLDMGQKIYKRICL